MLSLGLTKYLAIAIGVLLLALGALGLLYRGEVQAAGKLKERLKATELSLVEAQQAAVDAVLREQHANQILAERERERTALRRQARELKARIDALRKKEPDIEDYMALPVPTALLDELRKASENPRPAAP